MSDFASKQNGGKPPIAKSVRVRPVPAVTRSIAILRFLGQQKAGLGVKAIADALDMIPSTCLHILRVLVAEELVRVDPANKHYSLGNGMISLARSVLDRGGFARIVQPGLDRIAAQFGITAMGVEVTPRESLRVLAVAKPDRPFQLHADVGSEFPALTSATGRLVAAFGDLPLRGLRAGFEATNWNERPAFDQWLIEVEGARTVGWAQDRNGFVKGLTAVAAPVLDTAGRMTHSIVGISLSSELSADQLPAIAAMVVAEAARVADQL